jgi:hypothetical protein
MQQGAKAGRAGPPAALTISGYRVTGEWRRPTCPWPRQPLRGRNGCVPRPRVSAAWPLFAVLATRLDLLVRLMPTNSASGDEAIL